MDTTAMTDGSFRTALTIAGTDPTGGAGIGADIRTFSDHSVLPLAVITSVNAQNTGAFLHAELVDAARVTDQLRAVFDDVPVDAIKIGMLGTARQATAVATFLRALAQRPPIVVDPVLRSTSGAPLIDAAGVDILRAEILDMATVITPNRSEADRLALEEDPARWAASHPAAVLITGGDDGGAGGRVEPDPAVPSRRTRGEGAPARPLRGAE